jgi:putative glycosyltransferase (TIGR04372 family)
VLAGKVRQAAGLLIDPLRLILRRPSRLLFALFLVPGFFPDLSSLALAVLPIGWLSGERGRAFRLAVGNLLLQQDRPEQAWAWVQRALRDGRASTEEYFLGSVCLYQGLGRMREATSLFAQANEASAKEAERLGLAGSSHRVLNGVWARHIGDAATLDYVIKLGILEGRQRDGTILYVPRGGRLGNRFLVQQLAAHLRLVERPDDLPFAPAAVEALNFHYQFPRLADGTTEFFWELAAKTQRRWHAQGRAPLLTLPPEIEAEGFASLHRLGLPKGAWFVALHLRDIRWKGLYAGMHAMRNVRVNDYLPAIAEITRRGGWVVRLGNADAPRLPRLANVIDLARSGRRADWMDIFVIARSRFMLGCASGPSFVSPLYGVPAVLTNWWPPAMRPWHAADIFIPKLPRQADGRYLTLSETLREPLSYCHSPRYLAEHEGVEVVGNDPETIRGAVDEMLSRTQGDVDVDGDIADLRARADRLYESHGHFGGGLLARDFLRRHGDLIA